MTAVLKMHQPAHFLLFISDQAKILWLLSIFITHTVGRFFFNYSLYEFAALVDIVKKNISSSTRNNHSLNPSDVKDISSGLHDDHPSKMKLPFMTTLPRIYSHACKFLEQN